MNERYGITASVEELVRQRRPATSVRVAPTARVRTFHAGPYDSTFRGRGMEFDEARIYQPGDDVRTIDWRVTARTGRVHTKLFHEERERPVLLLIDARPSMRFGTRDAFKSVLAARAAATLAWAARDGGDRVGGMILTGAGAKELAPQRSRARLLSFLRAMSDATCEEGESAMPSLADSIARLHRVSRPGTLVFVLSDFNDLDEEAARQLVRLARRADLACLLIYHPLEAAPPGAGRYRISDGERVLTLAAEDPRWRAEYVSRFEARRRTLQDLCRQHRAAFFALRTGDDCGEILRADRFARAFRSARADGGLA